MLAVFALVAAALAFTATSGRVDFLPRRRRRAAEPHGGEYVWDNQNKGWGARCSASACDWKIVGDTGAGRSITQLAIQNGTRYAAWCGPCNGSFEPGILTNAGGTAHQLTLATDGSFPNRFIQGVAIDPADTSHVYVVFNGLSRRWTNTFSAGEGHVYESTNAGSSWMDISGNLPDIPGDDLVITASHRLVVATDVGVVVSSNLHGGTWTRLGTLPNVSVNDLQLIDGGTRILATTHGRGLWQISTP
jgi:hypothetical protein